MSNKVEFLFSRVCGSRDNFTSVEVAEAFVRAHGHAGLAVSFRGRAEDGRRTACSRDGGSVRTVAAFRALLADEATKSWFAYLRSVTSYAENERVSVIGEREAQRRSKKACLVDA
jgi:hypothetical protein